jgi:hypothetical protein
VNKKMKWLLTGTIVGLLVLAFAIPALAAGPNGINDNASTNTAQARYGNCQGLGLGPDQEVADLLEMTQVQIQEQRLAGKSLVQIAATKNISEETLVNTIMADRQQLLQKQVTDGTITQAQADQCLTQMKERVQLAVNRTTVGPPEWAGANGNGQNKSGMRQGVLKGNQNCTGASGTCAGSGNMIRGGRSSR